MAAVAGPPWCTWKPLGNLVVVGVIAPIERRGCIGEHFVICDVVRIHIVAGRSLNDRRQDAQVADRCRDGNV